MQRRAAADLVILGGVLFIGAAAYYNRGAVVSSVSSAISDVSGLLSKFPGAGPFMSLYQSAAETYGVPVGILVAQGNAESAFDPNAVSSAGAQGIAQFEPATAAQFGIDPFDPAQAIPAQANYLSSLYHQFGSWYDALVAYNWGPGNLSSQGILSAPSVSLNYANGILTGAGIA